MLRGPCPLPPSSGPTPVPFFLTRFGPGLSAWEVGPTLVDHVVPFGGFTHFVGPTSCFFMRRGGKGASYSTAAVPSTNGQATRGYSTQLIGIFFFLWQAKARELSCISTVQTMAGIDWYVDWKILAVWLVESCLFIFLFLFLCLMITVCYHFFFIKRKKYPFSLYLLL